MAAKRAWKIVAKPLVPIPRLPQKQKTDNTRRAIIEACRKGKPKSIGRLWVLVRDALPPESRLSEHGVRKTAKELAAKGEIPEIGPAGSNWGGRREPLNGKRAKLNRASKGQFAPHRNPHKFRRGKGLRGGE